MRNAAPFLLLVFLAACEGNIVGERGALPAVPPLTTEPIVPVEELPAFVPAPLRPRLLLARQYQNAIADLLGPAAAAAVTPPRDVPVNGLSAIGSAQLSISSSAVDAYEANAYLAAAAALTERRSALITCAPATPTDAACMRQLAQRFVPRAFRRPATEAELTRWTQVGITAATAYAAFDRGVEFMLAGLLQSPAFLYLDEVGVPDAADASRRRLTPWELASRLSFFLTHAPPDDELLAAAANGGLNDEAGMRTQAKRLLHRPQAREAMTELFGEILDLSQLGHLAKDAQTFPGFQVSLGASMREETQRTLLDLAFDQPTDFREIFTRRTTFVDAPLAQHYGLAAVTGWTAVQLPADRAGIFTQASFLALQSHPSANSPTYRGRFIRERLLCQTIPAPPPEASTTLPEPPTGTRPTLRQRVAQHMQSPSCSGCHQMMDPIGFAFEGFDAIGRRQALDNGSPVDASGALDDRGSYTDAPGLMRVLHDDPRVMSCLTRVVFRQGVGHVDLRTEARPLRAAEEAFIASGYRYQSLLEELVASEAFRTGTLETP
ncbi:MAG: DUF1592 domain-containing protein [Archangium sp.]|nr:DUF1592 domain-containing protein [Archangium sp.]